MTKTDQYYKRYRGDEYINILNTNDEILTTWNNDNWVSLSRKSTTKTHKLYNKHWKFKKFDVCIYILTMVQEL